jgi:hypothetical protein
MQSRRTPPVGKLKLTVHEEKMEIASYQKVASATSIDAGAQSTTA